MSTREKIRTIIAREENLPLAPPEKVLGSLKRDIPKNHEYDARALRPLVRALFSASVALGHTVTAYREFARIKSASISPDGMIGGRGYVLEVREVRAKFQQACELLSSLTDTLHDEVQGPHWKPKMADLSPNEAEDISELLSESDEALLDPEKVGDKGIQEIEKRNDGPGGTPGTKTTVDRIQEAEGSTASDGASNLPGTGGNDSSTPMPPGEQAKVRQASLVEGNSSLPVNTLPGPRVDHLDRGLQTGPGGSYNVDEPPVEDKWGLTDGVAHKPQNSTWGSASLGQSIMPSDDTPTEAFDFGLGFGAKGQGAGGYGTLNPDGKGFFGPQSKLPGHLAGWGSQAESKLPFGGPDSVARTDYYPENKGNLVNSESELPAGPSDSSSSDRGLPNTSLVVEQQAVPYVKRDWSTKTIRNDPQDLYRMDDNG